MAEAMPANALESELERRLEQLFPEEEGPERVHAPQPEPDRSLLAELKKIVLSIDWEITPEAIASFIDQVRLLREALREDRVAGVLLNMLGALGYYIQASRSQVHPWTFPVLNAVFSRLEEVVALAAEPENERRRRIQPEINAYQQLRTKIAQGRQRQPVEAAKAAARTGDGGQSERPLTAEVLARALAELREQLLAEIRSLRLLLEARGPGR